MITSISSHNNNWLRAWEVVVGLPSRWRNILRFSGLIFIVAGVFAGLPSPWPTVLALLGLGQVLAAGGFG